MAQWRRRGDGNGRWAMTDHRDETLSVFAPTSKGSDIRFGGGPKTGDGIRGGWRVPPSAKQAAEFWHSGLAQTFRPCDEDR